MPLVLRIGFEGLVSGMCYGLSGLGRSPRWPCMQRAQLPHLHRLVGLQSAFESVCVHPIDRTSPVPRRHRSLPSFGLDDR